MAKDNQSKRSDPGAAKTTKSKPGAEKTVLKKNWDKTRWIKHATEVGIPEADKMTVAEIRASLKKLKEQGELEDGRKNNGRPTIDVIKMQQHAVELVAEHAMTEVEVLIKDHDNPGEPKRVKMTRVEAIMTKLFTTATGGNVAAMTAYLDRYMGKAKQAIEHSGEIKVEEQNQPSPEEVAAARAYEDALEKGMSVPSPLRV